MQIDNFMLTMWQQCPAKFALRREGWTTRRKSGALGFGGAIHEGLAAWYRTGELGAAIARINECWPDNVPSDDYRTKEKCMQVMMEYTKKYPHETFSVVVAGDKLMIEQSFTLDTGMYLDCLGYQREDGSWQLGCGQPADPHGSCQYCGHELEPIEYGGVMDGLIEFGPQVYILEHKSTSQLGSSYFNQFKPNNQVTGYVWAAGQMSGLRVGGALINAIGVYKVGTTKFERQTTSRSPQDIAEWLENLRHECNAIRRHEISGHYPFRTTSCTMYGLCEFHSVHILPEGTARQKRLELDYVKQPWDYERRDEATTT